MDVCSPSAGGLNSPERKPVTAPNTPVTPSLMALANVFQPERMASWVPLGTPSRSRMLWPTLTRAPVMLVRMSVPSFAQSSLAMPSQMAFTISGSFSTTLGMASTRLVPSLTIISTAAGISSGSAAISPSARPISRSVAAVVSVGRFSIRKPARLVSRLVAISVMGPIFLTTASTTACSRSMAAGSRVSISPGSSSAMVLITPVAVVLMTGIISSTWPRMSSSAVFTVPSSSSASPGSSAGLTPSCSDLATLPMLSLAASTSGWKAGISTSPMLFFSASLVAFIFCMESSNDPILARFSSLKTVPMASASLPSSFHALLPASISGFSSLALLPNSSMASASRSAGFSILPSCSMMSQKTSSLLRKFPSKSRQLTPTFTKASWALSLPSWALFMLVSSLVMLPVMVSTLVSMKLLA